LPSAEIDWVFSAVTFQVAYWSKCQGAYQFPFKPESRRISTQSSLQKQKKQRPAKL